MLSKPVSPGTIGIGNNPINELQIYKNYTVHRTNFQVAADPLELNFETVGDVGIFRQTAGRIKTIIIIIKNIDLKNLVNRTASPKSYLNVGIFQKGFLHVLH